MDILRAALEELLSKHKCYAIMIIFSQNNAVSHLLRICELHFVIECHGHGDRALFRQALHASYDAVTQTAPIIDSFMTEQDFRVVILICT